MIKTVVFGGTFDPPHIGHKHLLESVMSEGYDSAIVIPAAVPPHKTRNGNDFESRFSLTKQMFADMPNVTVSDIENKRDGKSYTFDTLSILREQYPDRKLYLLMGSDMLLSIEKWYRFEEILRKTPIISAARTESDVLKITEFSKSLREKYDCEIIVYTPNIVDISSTQLRSSLVKAIDEHNRKNLSPSRYAHVNSVADYALTLAAVHGIDPFNTYVAALAHDCTKYMDDDAQLDYFEKNNIILTKDEQDTPKIWHQISGAHFAKAQFGITDADVLNAIRYHTTGREAMSPLEKLICLADSIEPRRDYDGVEKMRDTAIKDLDAALILSFERLIEYIKQRGLNMNPQTLKAYECLTKGKTMDQTQIILKTAVENLYKKKGKEIRILKVDDITVMADYFVICTGTSNTQLKALAGEVEFKLGEMGIEPLHTEGYGSSNWVLLDYGSVIVHVFYRDTRDYYNLERLWADGTEIPFTDFITVEEDDGDEI